MTDALAAAYILPLTEDCPFAVCLLDEASDEIIWANYAMQEWCGTSLRRLKGSRPWDVFTVAKDVAAMSQKCVQTQTAITIRDCEIRLDNKSNSQLYRVTAYPTSAGIGLSIMLTRTHAKDSQIGGQLVSGMGRMIAHELKNPLAGIKGAAQLLRDDVSTEEGLGLIDLIGSEIDRVRRLLDRMETLGDQSPENTENVNIHEILRRARKIIQSADPSLMFTEKYDPSLPFAIGDSDSLMQALLNIIKNASEAVGENGEIIMETAFRSGVTGPSQNGQDGQSLPIEIRIIDNGPGIDRERQDQIFQPFVTTKSGGQGLGLALVCKVAQAHGGLVEVTSRPGRTVFSFLLPAPKNALELDLASDMDTQL